jgi:hypothetical protein
VVAVGSVGIVTVLVMEVAVAELATRATVQQGSAPLLCCGTGLCSFDSVCSATVRRFSSAEPVLIPQILFL